MSAQHHPPDKKATPLAGGVETADTTGQYKTNDTPTPPAWQDGVAPALVDAVNDHRRCNPARQLPPGIQLALASQWRAHSGALR